MPLISGAQEVYTTEYLMKYELTYHLDSTNLKSKAIGILYLFTGREQSVFMNYNTAHAEEIEISLDRLYSKLKELETRKQEELVFRFLEDDL